MKLDVNHKPPMVELHNMISILRGRKKTKQKLGATSYTHYASLIRVTTLLHTDTTVIFYDNNKTTPQI